MTPFQLLLKYVQGERDFRNQDFAGMQLTEALTRTGEWQQFRQGPPFERSRYLTRTGCVAPDSSTRRPLGQPESRISKSRVLVPAMKPVSMVKGDRGV